jgi:squalene-hopene/tetraprenyl-beta-curcumene cyclase
VRIDRRTFLLAAIAAAGCSRRDDGDPLRLASEYLWAQQAEDGGFKSTTYGLLRSGQSLTPLVLGALLLVPHTTLQPRSGAVERALDFINKNANADGVDYPNYAASLAVYAIVKAQPGDWQRTVTPMIAQLRAQQFTEANGWKPSDPPYGAWGMGGPIHRPPDAGHVDLSMTRYVMEALKVAGVSASDPAMTRALVYLQRSQNVDGGFYFSTVNLETNKAGEAEGLFASYGTATADGLLALRAAGVPDTDERIVSAMKWLKDHHQPDRAPGFDGARESWASALRYYYADVITRAMPDLHVQLPPQETDGSFRNSNNMVKEDDPLIATSFAVSGLARQRSPLHSPLP